MIPIENDAVETITRGLEKRLEELEIGTWAETIQTREF